MSPETVHDTNFLSSLAGFLEKSNSSATYACGGTIKISPNAKEEASTSSSQADCHNLNRPVTLRWDNTTEEGGNSKPFKLLLPNDYDGNKDNVALDQLLKDSQPATFGHGGKDVLDEAYRKASKMDTTQFCTDFNPYEVGICDVIARVLMPSVKGVNRSHRIRAELYKLNVYSGPSGRFRPHVDTPRASSQIGSLVVNLPYSHQGGQLAVRHHGQTIEFDWSDSAGPNTNEIRWAAFYSDCEHEVLEVTEGHRITLTYNLYAVQGHSMDNLRCIDPTQLPMYGFFQMLLNNPLFMVNGGILGMPCAHAYPHTDRKEARHVHATLKGVDMALCGALRALNLQVRLRPILVEEKLLYYDRDFDSEDEDERTIVGRNMHRLVLGGCTEDCGLDEIFEECWPFDFEHVLWVTGYEERRLRHAISYTAYGNQHTSEMAYSFPAFLVTVPPSSQRSPDGKQFTTDDLKNFTASESSDEKGSKGDAVIEG